MLQQDDRVVVVGSGVRVAGIVPWWVDVVELPENRGVTGGRNAGWQFLKDINSIDVVVNVDDDGYLPNQDTANLIRESFARFDRLGVLAFRITDEEGETQRRHVPRLGGNGARQASEVTTFLGGCHALRAEMLHEIGCWPEEFFYAHEETDLSWRALDAGWTIYYNPELQLVHPKTTPARHKVYYRMTARNRVWLARRHLPSILVPIYLPNWTIITLLRRPPIDCLREWFSGFFEGWRTVCGERNPIRWSTVLRMAKIGRPPIV